MVAPAVIYTGLSLGYFVSYLATARGRYVSEAQTQSNNLKLGYNNVKDANLTSTDAFRHMYAAAKSTIEFGTRMSEFGGYLVEGKEYFFPKEGFESDRDPRSANMDLHNNGLGRQIGQEVGELAIKNGWSNDQIGAEIAKRVDAKIKNGEAIVLDKDPNKKSIGADGKETQDDGVADPRLNIAYNKSKDRITNFWTDLGNDINEKYQIIEKKFIDLGRYIVDPLTLDLNGDGIALTNADTSKVKFDMDNDGFKEQTGWIDGKDGFLVRDLNNNGKIDNLTELVGSATAGGMSMMQSWDLNKDGVINNKDTIWNTLKVWQDKNSNGITDAGELNTLATHKITQVNYDKNWKTAPQVQDNFGNTIAAKSTFTINGVTRNLQESYFRIRQEITEFVYPKNYTPHADTLKMPELAGGGTITPLGYAMTQNKTLRDKIHANDNTPYQTHLKIA